MEKGKEEIKKEEVPAQPEVKNVEEKKEMPSEEEQLALYETLLKRKEEEWPYIIHEKWGKTMAIMEDFKSNGPSKPVPKYVHTSIMDSYSELNPIFEVLQESQQNDSNSEGIFRITLNTKKKLLLKVILAEKSTPWNASLMLAQYYTGKCLNPITKQVTKSISLMQIDAEQEGKMWVELLMEYDEMNLLSYYSHIKQGESIQILNALVDVLCLLDDRGLCVLNLKPENIYINDDINSVKISDLRFVCPAYTLKGKDNNLVYYYAEEMKNNASVYTAPEIKKFNRDLINGEKAVTFALGIILCELLEQEMGKQNKSHEYSEYLGFGIHS